MIYKGIGLRVNTLISTGYVSFYYLSIGHGMVLKDFWGDSNRQGYSRWGESHKRHKRHKLTSFHLRNALSQMSVWCRTFLQLAE